MEVLICTSSKDLWKKLLSLAESFLIKKKSRYISVSYNMFTEKEKLIAAIKKYPAAIVILDVQSFDNWREIATELEKLSKTVRICLVSGTYEQAAAAINSLTSICGYLCKSGLNETFAEVFTRICEKIKTVCGGIAVTHYNSVDKIIPFDEILFIETVKQTHMCKIVHKNGTDEIRADISKLISELPCVFRTVRSSTIANMSEVKAFSDCELFFSDGSSCFCGKKYSSEITPFLKRRVLY